MASSSDCLAKLNNGMKKIYRAQDVREETELKMRAYANWGEFLVPGPMSISILGELVFISANTDFAINRFAPNKTYTHIKHPESFRACLMQVCNDGWKAFNTAHTNMDKIRLLSLSIPNDVKLVVQTLMQKDKVIVEALLPPQLKKMRVISSKCFGLAEEVENGFQSIIELISELLENCTSAKSAHQESMKKVIQAIQETKLKKKTAEMLKIEADIYHKTVQKQMEESQETYKEAINSMPSGADMIGFAIVDAMVKVTTFIPNLKNRKSTTSQEQQTQGASQSLESDAGATMNIASKAGIIVALSQSLLEFVSEDKIDMTKLRDQKTNEVKSNSIGKQFQDIAALLKKEKECEVKKPALSLCEEGKNICDLLQKELDNGSQVESSHQEAIPAAIHDLVDKANKLSISCNGLTNTAAFQQTQGASQSPESDAGTTMSITSKVGIVVALSQGLLEFVSEDKIDMTKLRDQKTNEVKSNSIGKQFKDVAALLKKEKECEVKKPALTLCEEGKNICDLLQKELDNGSQVESSHQEAIPAAIHDLIEKANKFSISCNGLTNTAAFQQTQGASQSPESDAGATMNIASKAGIIVALSQGLLEFVSEDKIDMTKLRDQKTNKAKSNSIGKQFKDLAALLEKEKECEVKKPALSLCEEGKNICDLLQKELDNESQVESSHQEAIPAAIHDLVEKANKFSISCNGLTNTAAFQPSAPNASKAQQGSSYSENILSSVVQASHMRIEQSKEQLRACRAEYHKTFEDMKKCTQEFDSILTEMRNLEVEKIDFDTTIKMLAKGLEALGSMREQWTKMVQFFQMMSNLIETCLNINISDFVSKCESIPAIPNYQHLDFIKDMLYGPAFQASNIAHLVHMISETYVQVSNKYLMDRISNLTTLMSLEVGSDKFDKARLELQKGCQEAQKGILELVQRNREEFDEKIDKRIDSINRNLKAVLPTPSREEQKAIEDTVHKAPQKILKEISAEDADQFA